MPPHVMSMVIRGEGVLSSKSVVVRHQTDRQEYNFVYDKLESFDTRFMTSFITCSRTEPCNHAKEDLDRTFLNREFPVSAKQLFETIFGESNFWKRYLQGKRCQGR